MQRKGSGKGPAAIKKDLHWMATHGFTPLPPNGRAREALLGLGLTVELATSYAAGGPRKRSATTFQLCAHHTVVGRARVFAPLNPKATPAEIRSAVLPDSLLVAADADAEGRSTRGARR